MRLFLWALAASPLALAVKPEDFKTCSQSSFCRRLRGIARRYNDSPSTFSSPYSVLDHVRSSKVEDHSGRYTFAIGSSLYPDIRFELRVDMLEQGEGIVRLRMDEVGSTTPFRRYNETGRWALVDPEPPLSAVSRVERKKDRSVIHYGPSASKLRVEVEHKPFKLVQYRANKVEMVINDRSLFHMEHHRLKEVEKVEEIVGEGEQMVKGGEVDRAWFEESDAEMFEERFRQWTDSKPKGPEALSVDITFPGVHHIYGLPEHASPLSLPDTTGPKAHYSDPYRLYNVDIFEYLADSPMALYGAIPLLHAHSAEHSVGVLNLVGSDTFVDVEHKDAGVSTHWMSESGILDLLLLPGPQPRQLFEQYAILTGPTALPPQWSTAYHQCRWNYIDEQDVMDVQRRFDEVDIPLDVTWLDIEYAEEHRYFDWAPKHFPDPVRMQEAVAAKGRKMVAIVDPHIKKTDDFRIYNDAKDLDILVKRADGSNFDGWCWTGSSVWVDFFNPKSWDWWTKMFSFGVWKESTPSLFIWNDMNEPSVFDGPEISVPRDTIHYGGWENRDVHNINGMLFHNQTAEALIARQSPAQRPFVLSRSFFAGSQRLSAIWTGDNMGTWEHFAGETAMLLSNNIAGMTFAGADVGGFFGNPSHELLVRWYQAGAFMPFFRAHAHIDTKRREPYLYDEPIRGYIRHAIRTRYQLLSVWYNAFHDASTAGWPIMRPQYVVFPQDKNGFAVDDQYYVGGEGLLVKPVTTEGATTTDVYLADDQPYYDYFTHSLHPHEAGQTITLDTPLDVFPVLLQGGSILPIRQRVRRASPLMWQDPFTLVIALNKEGGAHGQVYLDDGVGYDYQQGAYVWKEFSLSGKGKIRALTSRPHPKSASKVGENGLVVPAYKQKNAWEAKIAHVEVERIVILGLDKQPSSVTSKGSGQAVEYQWEEGEAASGKRGGQASRLTIKKPGLRIVEDWELEIA